ncbi:penicillin-binding protein 1A [Sphingomonas sp. CFBP 13720]|uniref:penicillin-binding protein 1A n=1 Tax=Sphingomonas sp. CFBP 13720 TaxID=2775302 RepID=UPI00177D91C8|nr:PBP1A family penicillin-binding protein [Sphingomonas sp. CFBP 13720]MBD8678660.1 PBP1A family penicillin-binding protein [Sphingomonas sp. CFBP 13720]
MSVSSTDPTPVPPSAHGGWRARFRQVRRRWWFRIPAFLALLAGIGVFLIWLLLWRTLPSVETLRAYEPPLPTNVRTIDGTPVHRYERERRVQLSYAEYPPLLVKAFLAAEDRTFFDHHGVDYPGIASAMLTNLRNDGRPIGASTITQQVAKNLLLTNEVSYVRKAKEALLAYRIENVLTKQQILELYLNQIALGRNAFGVEAAANAYFGKELRELTLPQMAYLAILPKGPSNYTPERGYDRAIARRDWVLGEMLRNNFITAAQRADAVAQPLGTIERRTARVDPVGGYFIEEVRRQLLDRFGTDDKSGPYSVYAGGLWVRTSFDPAVQAHAQDALRAGLIRFDSGRGWSGPLNKPRTKIEGDRWLAALQGTNIGIDYQDWQAAIVIDKSATSARIGFVDGRTGQLPRGAAAMPARGLGGTAFAALEPGDIVAVAPSGGAWALRSVPRVSGGMVVEDPRTGRILAMQGGFDSRIQSFNRATQAMRQPGSTIKPIVYAAALEAGMTPASIIVDGPFCVNQGGRLSTKCFRNFGGGGSGPHTMRWGIEQSRNLMTVRAAAQTGMDKVNGLIQRVGISDQKFPPYLSYALGAGETTVTRMVNAYSILVNQGRELKPTVIDFVQDRRGKVILPENWRACDRCNAPDWDGKPMPRPQVRTRQVMDAMSAYQMVHIMEGVIQRGTATTLRDLNRPIMGKTGTSTGPTDVWFVGGTPQMIAGLYLGYDSPRNLGGYAQGGTIAAPIYKAFAQRAYKDVDVLPFRAPAGVRMVRIDRGSGRPVYGAWPTTEPKAAVIWEAFKPESEPRRATGRLGTAAAPVTRDPTRAAGPRVAPPPRDSDFLQREGGIY